MKKINCVSYFVNRPCYDRIINVVTPNQKIKIKKATRRKLNKLVCNYRELYDL